MEVKQTVVNGSSLRENRFFFSFFIATLHLSRCVYYDYRERLCKEFSFFCAAENQRKLIVDSEWAVSLVSILREYRIKNDHEMAKCAFQ